MSSLEPCNVVNSKDLQHQFESEPIRSDKGPASLNLTPAGYCVVVVVWWGFVEQIGEQLVSE